MRTMVLALTALATWVGGEAEAAGPCNRTCTAGQKRNPVTGCCEDAPVKPPPEAPPRVKAPPRAKACPEGQERTGFTAGHCCWPGQEWSRMKQACSGTPSACPDELTASGDECVARPRVAPPSRPAAPASLDGGPGGIDWVVIPGGSFMMGSTEGDEDEKPVHRVTLSRYAMARTETTVSQYRRCVDAGSCSAPASNCSSRPYGTWGVSGKERHPVNCVNWGQARDFCRWAGGRLPTEAEWEYGARGPEGRRFPWGDEDPVTTGERVGNFADATAKSEHSDWTVIEGYRDGYAETSPVGSFPAGRSPLGLDDMAGNVWEWVSDWYGDYTSDAATDPTGVYTGSERVYRGGGFVFIYVPVLRGADRFHAPPSFVGDALGFRCARSVP